MNATRDLLRQLRQLGIEVWRESEGFLGYRAPEGAMTPALMAALRQQKAELLQLLGAAAPIEPVSRAQPLRLSFAQERLWFASQYQGNNAGYNMPVAFRLVGALNRTVLEQSLLALVERHESLRTTFGFAAKEAAAQPAESGEGLFQKIGAAHFQLAYMSLEPLDPAAQERTVQQLASAEARQPFDLANDLLLRARLVALGPTDHLLLLTIHHIVCDAWSIHLLLRELGLLYTALSAHQSPTLPPLPIQSADHAAWQRQWIQSPAAASQRDYWLTQLAGAPTALELPTDRPRPPLQSHAGAAQRFSLPPALSDGVRALSQRAGCTLFMTLLASWQTLLYRYSGQEEILVGASVAGRHQLAVEAVVGLFLNNLIYRSKFHSDLPFAQLLQQLRQTASDAYAHQEYPFDQLVNDLHLPRDLSRNPLAQVRFAFHAQADQGGALHLPGIQATALPPAWESARFDLNLVVEEHGSRLTATLAYSTDLFDADTVARMAGHWQELLAEIVAAPETPVGALRMLSAAERRKLLVDWNQTAVPLPLDQPFSQLFAEQVRRTPQAVAAVCDQQTLTYAELEQRVSQMAEGLAAAGVSPDRGEQIVALLAHRNLNFLTALLAIFKAGGVYLPIDPRTPPERLQQVLTQSQTAILLVDPELAGLADQAADATVRRLGLETLASPTTGAASKEAAGGERLVYVIYTSGSTGIPKGAMVESRGMVNHLYAKIHDLGLTAADRVAQTAPQSFDISVWQFLAALLVGGTVYIYRDEIVLNPTLLLERVQEDAISVWETVPSLMHVLVDHLGSQPAAATAAATARIPLPALRWLIPTGEALPPQLANQWLQLYPHIPLLNAYGPTECSDDVTHCLLQSPLPESCVHTPIGRPVMNLRTYILDNRREPLPVGVPGELWIGGVGVGRGYLHDPERTAAAFFPDPFVATAGARIYRSGDRARYLPDGRIEYLGRVDSQVKVRGFRIELGEIEAVLRQHTAVREVVVVVQEDGERALKSLVAYIVAQTGQPTASLREHLRQKLPEYMVPAFFVYLEALPLTPNGKVDRRALPAVTDKTKQQDKAAEPATALERYLAEAWRQVLKTPHIGRHDNFFEIGGDSIRGAILINQLQQHFGEVLYVVALFDAPTLAELAAYLMRHYGAAVERVTGTVVADGAGRQPKIDEAAIADFRRRIPPLEALAAPLPRKNRRAVFVLSAPRSGSTLFRVMLGGHAQLFSPPELDLLGFSTMGSRARELGGRFSFRLEGLIRAVMALRACDADQARQLLARYEAAEMPMQAFYGQLQEWVGEERLLVDKTPIYALDPQTLARAEEFFDEVCYIHLLRHPAAMIRSFEEARTDQVFLRQAHPYSARQLAELVWVVSHRNILAFLATIPPARQHRVHYEALVADPGAAAQAICAFLDLPYDPRMADPYQDQAQRMTDGIYTVSKMLGDPKFHTHRRVDPQAAERWREHYTEDFIGEATWQLAEQVGYQRPALTRQGAAAAPGSADPGPVVAIEGRGQRTPFFCVHDVNGTVHSFYQLARALGNEQPFYGLQGAQLLTADPPIATVEALASRYVAAIRQVQPAGPYLLGGYSLGCQIALELARQLLASGESVAQLILLDGRPPLAGEEEQRLDPLQWLLHRAYSMLWRQGSAVPARLETFAAALQSEQGADFPEQVALLNRQLAALQLPQLSTADLVQEQAIFDWLRQLSYPSAQAVKVPATFFYTQEHRAARFPASGDSALGWRQYLPGLLCQEVAGNHLSLLFDPQVQHLARQIGDCLAASLERRP
jgi:amino acid adenylation domain-containing protein